ncbi:Holliday junction resolvase RuvX [Patulibacter brassicae]|uniref:Putative pre-16S rRNA nuclease n=1 Tax=Patulibacter brassicae TaxID=1705717 RepID=A0ABU4VRZ0_9ACTN|nr:Holliday junction resolvase RuvX [Patulibacter brassicae]MDX8153663.1 Holliday junction resolvase RuvX [Patulibacter brassicae]
MGLDYGSGRTGVAISDPTGTIVTPLPAVRGVSARRGRRELDRLIAEREVGRVVVGLPVGLRGETAQTEEARAFAAALAERLGPDVPVELYDERFTTRMAQQAGGSADEDSRAAAVLLEEWLRVRGG